MMLIDFFNKNKKRIFFGLFAILQTADLLAVHFLIVNKILPGSKKILAVIDSGKMQYNTEGYFTGIIWANLLVSAIVGGLLVFGILKITELLLKELKITEGSIPAGFVVAGFIAVYIILLLVAIIAGWNLYNVGCPLLAYFTGWLMWASMVKWKSEIEKGIKI
ncbi:MAG: hypothetical protein E7388_05050 [Ruminococcaceae bacterium]|nr:hypothetical protein [Oscillospiraceae bacterium]